MQILNGNYLNTVEKLELFFNKQKLINIHIKWSIIKSHNQTEIFLVKYGSNKNFIKLIIPINENYIKIQCFKNDYEILKKIKNQIDDLINDDLTISSE